MQAAASFEEPLVELREKIAELERLPAIGAFETA